MLAGTAADKVREFYTKFPAHPKAKDAQAMELKLLDVAVQLGSTNRRPQLLALEDKRLGDPSVAAEEKFMLRAQRVIKLPVGRAGLVLFGSAPSARERRGGWHG